MQIATPCGGRSIKAHVGNKEKPRGGNAGLSGVARAAGSHGAAAANTISWLYKRSAVMTLHHSSEKVVAPRNIPISPRLPKKSALCRELTVVLAPGWNSLIGGLIVTPNGRIVLTLREAYDYMRSLPESNTRDDATRAIDLAARGQVSFVEARKACVDAIYGKDSQSRMVAKGHPSLGQRRAPER